MCSYCKRHEETEVPDPYYGGQQGFEKVNDHRYAYCYDTCEVQGRLYKLHVACESRIFRM